MWALTLVVALAVAPISAKVTVHMCPHTHDDTGWLKTVDQYHFGSNNSIQFAGTQYILDSVVQALQKDPQRRFVYIEQAFFYRWWAEQDEDTKSTVRTLVDNHQLQFANGGWCMHDEAATYYIDMIDQTTLGHRFLKNELNVIPKVGWQIDPFGHSATNAALLSSVTGFLAIYFGRADFQEYKYRAAQKTREFTWAASPSLSRAELLGGILLTNHYGPPKHFHWDVISPDELPIIDDPTLNGYNVNERVERFVKHAMERAEITAGDDQMWTMGDDFNYQDANMWFKNMDKLIKAVNADGRVTARYSTPLDYTMAKLQSNVTFTRKTDDFFPYEDSLHAFWTGYYTSRAAFKRFVRDSSALYTALRQINAISNTPNDHMLPAMAQAMGLSQHHDAVTGTSKQHVVFDYAQRVSKASRELERNASYALSLLSGVVGIASFSMCPLLNETKCDATANFADGTLNVVVWNQLATNRTENIRIPVPYSNITVVSPAVQFQIYKAPTELTNYKVSSAPQSLPYVLVARIALPALGYNTITLAYSDTTHKQPKPRSRVSISNGIIKLSFDPVTNFLSAVTNVATGVRTPVTQYWCYYQSNTGDQFSGQPSGAYIFRPVYNTSCINVTNAATSIRVVANGPIEWVVEQTFATWLHQRIRLVAGEQHFTQEFTVGAIPIGDGIGKEVVSRFVTSINSSATLFTDSNGREMQRRVLNTRSFPFVQSEPISGNYFPVNALAFINDSTSQLSIAVDATNGGASLSNGQLELMVHRRILMDDWRGVGEPLNETQFITSYHKCGNECGMHYGPGLIIRGEHAVSLLPTASAMRYVRPLMDRVYAKPRFFFTSVPFAINNQSFLKEQLPPFVQLTTFELLNTTTLLVRLSHQMAIFEDPDWSNPVEVDLGKILRNIALVTNVTETTLTANAPIESITALVPSLRFVDNTWLTTLNPMEVRTFIVTLLSQ